MLFDFGVVFSISVYDQNNTNSYVVKIKVVQDINN